MNIFLKLFLCFMISLGQAKEDHLLQENGTPESLNELESLEASEMMGKLQSADNVTDSDGVKLGKGLVYVDEKCCNLSTTNACFKRKGNCIPLNETCNGNVYYGHQFCSISNLKSCKCCAPIDCSRQTLDPCKKLNGTCMSSCEGRSVSGKEFCNQHKTCKCCLPDDCPCGQDFKGGCNGYCPKTGKWQFGHCMKTCELGSFPLTRHKCNQTGSADCNCCTEICNPTIGRCTEKGAYCETLKTKCRDGYNGVIGECNKKDGTLCQCCKPPITINPCKPTKGNCYETGAYCALLGAKCKAGYKGVKGECRKSDWSTCQCCKPDIETIPDLK